MNLHISYDEKVITRTIHYFEEALPGENRFVVLTEYGKQGRIHVKMDESFLFYERFNSKSFWEAIGDIRQYDNVIIHYLGNEMCKFILKLPKSVNLTWIIWGADLYNNLLTRRGFKLYANPEDRKPKGAKQIFVHFFLTPLLELYKYRNRLKALKKIQNVVAFKGDLRLLYSYYPEIKKFKEKKFFYYPVDDIIDDSLKEVNVDADSIIVGNSASYTNNHRFVFEKIKELKLSNRKVIVPLSYGPNTYAVLSAGKLLGESFCPILDFMPLTEYNKMLASASTFIYGNFRPEAVGNILIALYLGAAVFLCDENPLFKDYSELGYIIYPLSKLKEKIDYKLTKDERQHNRELVFKLNNKELLLSNIRESFGTNE